MECDKSPPAVHVPLEWVWPGADAAALEEHICNAFIMFLHLIIGVIGSTMLMVALQLPVIQLQRYTRWRRLSEYCSIWLGVNRDALCREVVLYFLVTSMYDISLILAA